MFRAAALILLAAAPLGACSTVGDAGASGREVSAVVLDEGKRQEAAAAASEAKDADAGLAEVREGPSKAASAPN